MSVLIPHCHASRLIGVGTFRSREYATSAARAFKMSLLRHLSFFPRTILIHAPAYQLLLCIFSHPQRVSITLQCKSVTYTIYAPFPPFLPFRPPSVRTVKPKLICFECLWPRKLSSWGVARATNTRVQRGPFPPVKI